MSPDSIKISNENKSEQSQNMPINLQELKQSLHITFFDF